MERLRCSVVQDIPRLRELWYLAFGDDGAYVDNFFDTYYKPERMLVLEEDGVVQAMTAWFDTAFVVPEEGSFRAAYLYAVATHPDCRGKGMAGRLLAWADDHFRALGIPAVTTVPAEPSLHNFFGSNGFRECFTHTEHRTQPGPGPEGEAPFALDKLTSFHYQGLRESILAGKPHIDLGEEAVAYQAGACALTPGGGLYAADTGAGVALLCAEGMEDGSLLAKEVLGEAEAVERLLTWLPRLLPTWSGIWRCPGDNLQFGMLKWLDPARAERWDWERRAYLGLAFD